MIFRRLIAFPESRRIFKMHVAATPFLAVQWTAVAMIPVLMRDYFQASAWQVALTTSAIPVMHLFSVVWNEIYRRVSTVQYLVVLWCIAIAPMAGIALCHTPERSLIFIVISAAGFGAMTPISGDLLRSCYAPTVRGKIYGYLQIITHLVVMAGAYFIGVYLKRNPEAFRVYIPVSVTLVGVGIWLLTSIAREPLFKERHRHRPTESFRRSIRNVGRNAIRIFANDRDFRRYETAFFIYGIGWMICNALIPFIAVDRLNLNYEEVARSTQLTFELVLVLLLFPVGHKMDRHGPIPMATAAFALLGLYPIGLWFAEDVHGLMLATALFAVGISAVQLAWTIGPISLAKDASLAPYYLAIHATLVGLRAVFGQYPAVALYKWTQSFDVPLALASLSFLTGAYLMFRLARDRRAAGRREDASMLLPAEQAAIRTGFIVDPIDVDDSGEVSQHDASPASRE